MNTSSTQEIPQHITFTLAYNNYKKSLSSYAYFKTNDRTMAEDLVQNTFLKAWLYLNKNTNINNMEGLLRHILRHLIIDEYRKHKTISLDTLIENGFEPTINDQKRLMDILDGENAILLIKHLPEPYHRIMHMRFVQGLSVQEISLSTGQTKNAVAVLTHRGLQKLKALYTHA